MPIKMFKSNINGYFYQYNNNTRYYFDKNDKKSKDEAYSKCKKQCCAIQLNKKYRF